MTLDMERKDSLLKSVRLIVHGTWVEDHFFIWAESVEPSPGRRGHRPKLVPHPHAASPDLLRAALARWCPGEGWDTLPEAAYGIFLPSGETAPLLPPWLRAESAGEAEGSVDAPTLSPWQVKGLSLDLLTALGLLLRNA